MRMPAATAQPGRSSTDGPVVESSNLAHSGVSDGIRTRDNRDHNPVLYQLSYTHRVHPRLDQTRPDAQRPIVPGPGQCSEPDRGLGCRAL